MHRKLLFSLLIGLVFSVAGFYLAFRHVPLESLMRYGRSVDYRWIMAALAVLVPIYYLRTLRWQLMLRPVGHVSLALAYHSIMVSFMINCLLPGRMGEMARPLILKKRGGLAFTSTLATLAAERLLDLATLLALLFIALPRISIASAHPVVFGRHELSADLLLQLARTSAFGMVLLVAGLVLIAHDGLRQRLVALLDRIAQAVAQAVPPAHGRRVRTVQNHVEALLERFSEGLQYTKRPGNLLTVTLLSMLTWLLIGLSFYLVARGSPGIDLGLADTLVMLVVICLFIALPSVPGYWGLWEAAGVFALSFFGIAHEPAAGFTLFNHALQILPVIPAGWISCLLLGIGWSDIKPHDLSGRGPQTE